MMPEGLASLRPFDGWIRDHNPSKRQTLFLSSSIDFAIDLWNIIEYYSEVYDVGINFIKTKNLPTQMANDVIFDNFRSFVRQAKSNYDAAKSLPYRSSGLLYYYCFLNLAKAFIVLKYPDKMIGRIRHGLSYDPSSGNTVFEQEVLSVSPGVFSILYEIETGHPWQPKSTLNIVDILGFCSDILYQYQLGGFGNQKIYTGIYCIANSSSNKNSWSLWGIEKASDIENRMPDVYSRIISIYERTDINNHIANILFSFHRREWLQYEFYQSRHATPFEQGGVIRKSTFYNELIDTLHPHYSEHYFKDELDFDVNLRTDIGENDFNETLAIYAVMFYLSSLVRYRPDYIERILSERASWIISGFVNSCVLEFLKQISSRIIDKVIILSRR
jgi:hypothetical protein